MFYSWFVIFMACTGIVILPFMHWFKNEVNIPNMEFKTRTKIILSILAFILYILLIGSTAALESSLKSDSVVSVTEISDVYKSSADSQESSYYYILKEGDDKVYEIKVDKLSEGNLNYVITRKYPDDLVENELVVKDKENIKTLPDFNKQEELK